MMKKIVHITSAHPPFDKRVFVKECRSLASCYEVVYIAPHDKDEIVDGVTIRHFEKPKGRYARFVRSMWGAFRDAIKENAAVYHFHDPDLLPMGFLLKLAGKKVIYDPHEDHPRDMLIKDWIPFPLRRFLSYMVELAEFFGGMLFDGITPATEKIASRFPAKKTTVIHNYARIEEFVFSENENRERSAILVVSGTISRERGAVEILHAFAELRKTYPHLRLVFAGAFSTEDEEIFIRGLPEWQYATFLGWLPRKELSDLLLSACIGLSVLHPGPTHPESLPVKLFEYFASGLPVVASNFPLWKEIIEGDKPCGVTVDPKDPASIATGIRSILETPESAGEMGKNGITAAKTRYNWDNEEKKLLVVYKRLLG